MKCIRRTRPVGAACLVLAASAAHAQDDPQILFSTPAPWQSTPINGALFDLDLLAERQVFPADLLAALRRQQWDLVIVRWPIRYPPDVYFEILGELTDHVDGGGALMFSIAQLDEMPEYWPLLGIADARDLTLPLSDIRSPHPIRHPSVEIGGMNVSDELFGPDFGDALTPAPGASVVNIFTGSGDGAIVLAGNGRVIVNGQEWDNWFGFSAIELAADQIQWLLGCPVDLDGDGDLTVFDLFEFQNRFDTGGTAGFADLCYDGRLDVFDFLEFFNLFEAGCE